MMRTEGHLSGHDNLDLFYQTWLHTESDPPCPGTLVVTHGLSEHSECYNLFAEGMASSSWDIYAWDLRGHGRSEGKRGLVLSFDEYIKDLKVFIHHVMRQRTSQGKPVTPLVLLGHSMGGLITLKTVLQDPDLPITAVSLSSPALGVSMPIPWVKEKAAHLLSKWAPHVTLGNEVCYETLSHDSEVLKSYAADALRHNKVSSRLFLGLMESCQFVLNRAHEFKKPLYLQLSGEDLVVDQLKAEEFFANAASENKHMEVYKNSYHEIFNDVEREKVFQDLKEFLKGFSAPPP